MKKSPSVVIRTCDINAREAGPSTFRGSLASQLDILGEFPVSERLPQKQTDRKKVDNNRSYPGLAFE